MAYFQGVTGAVFYRHWAVAEGPGRGSLVFLHGLGQHSGDYHRFAATLCRAGIAVWALDHVGHGLTEGELGAPGPVPDLAANAGILVREARFAGEGLPLVLMGHSLGAGVALTLATAEPTCADGLVLCGAPLGPTRGSRDESTAESAEHWRSMREQVDVRLTAMPVLAVHGEDDRIIPVDGVRATLGGLAGVQFITYPEAGHDLLHEPVREEVAAEVVRFALSLS